jgi:hypothetical protein
MMALLVRRDTRSSGTHPPPAGCDPGAGSKRPGGRRSAEAVSSHLAARSGSAVSIPPDAAAS